MKRRQFLRLGATAPLAPFVGCGGGGGGTGGGTTGPTGPVTIATGADLAGMLRLASTGGGGSLVATLTAATASAQIASGATTEVWAYNGVSPGPLIDVNEGDTVRITFANRLTQPSTIHWHGVPVPPDQDGNPMDVVPPGANRVYDFLVPPGSAGTYWYHPHPDMLTAEQVFRGLAGMFIIRGPGDPLAGFEEKLLFITDLRIDERGAIPANTDADRIDGREGDHLLVNGRKQPRIAIRSGARQRWRIVNATNARFLKLAITGQNFVLVGTDGGLLASPVPMGEILLSPAERAEIIVTGEQPPGTTATLVARSYDRGRFARPGASPDVPVATLAYANDPPLVAPAIPQSLRSISGLGRPRATKRVVFSQSISGTTAQFFVNGASFSMSRVDLVGQRGEVEEWEVSNVARMDHPFHVHGGQFQIVSRTLGGVTRNEPFLAWKDTFNVLQGETVVFRMVQDTRGLRMFHCHILEHEDHGMMGVLEVR